MYEREFTEGVAEDLKNLRASDRKRILDKIDEQLTNNPSEETRNKKILVGLKPPGEHEEPVRELRVGKFRVFYDVDEEKQRLSFAPFGRNLPTRQRRRSCESHRNG